MSLRTYAEIAQFIHDAADSLEHAEARKVVESALSYADVTDKQADDLRAELDSAFETVRCHGCGDDVRENVARYPSTDNPGDAYCPGCDDAPKDDDTVSDRG